MKKQIQILIALPLMLALFFAGCKIKEYTPVLPVSFNQRAMVSMGDFSYECEICKNESQVVVNVLSTRAKGLSMCCDGDTLTLTYDNLTQSFECKDYEQTNAAILIYDVFECLEQNMQSRRLENGYKYYGTIPSGDFVLLQRDDNLLSSIEIKNCGIMICFVV